MQAAAQTVSEVIHKLSFAVPHNNRYFLDAPGYLFVSLQGDAYAKYNAENLTFSDYLLAWTCVIWSRESDATFTGKLNCPDVS